VIFGQEATPELVVYDRGGDSTATRNRLTSEKVKYVRGRGIFTQPLLEA
jgi:hypothetical protein